MKNLVLTGLAAFSCLLISEITLGKETPLKGFVSISSQKALYVDYVPAEGKNPTVILINGLTYSTRQWEKFAKNLIGKGVGVLRYDPIGQGETLLRYAPILSVIPYQEQVKDLRDLLTKMNLKGPYNLVGLSYGGGIAAEFTAEYPNLVKNLIMMAPFTRPLESTDNLIKAQVLWTRQFLPIYPFIFMSDDELYDYYLRQIVYTTYPAAEPIVLENPYKLEATFRLVQGIRKARPVDKTNRIPGKAAHLMIARQDQYIEARVLDEYWQAVPNGSRGSRIYINGSEHKMVEAVPNFTAGWVYEIVMDNKKLFEGRDFEGYPSQSKAVGSDGETIKLQL